MQSGIFFEREALHRLPGLLGELLGEPIKMHDLKKGSVDTGADATADVRGRRWVFEVKSSSRPGVVASAARQLGRVADGDAIRVLVVPFMTPGGARAAAERSLNWLDLSGNARLRTEDGLYVHVEGRPNQFPARGRPASPFAPKSSRIAHVMLLDPSVWWRQKHLVEATGLDDGQVSRVVRRLDDDGLLVRDKNRYRPQDPWLLVDAWVEDYRFDRHDIVIGHVTGAGVELARKLHPRLREKGINHAFTGLAAAWAMSPFARFRLNSLYVQGDPREAADAIRLRRNQQGANVQVIGPDDDGVFLGQRELDGLPCVSAVQTYLDLKHLPERAADAAEHLRDNNLLWPEHD